VPREWAQAYPDPDTLLQTSLLVLRDLPDDGRRVDLTFEVGTSAAAECDEPSCSLLKSSTR
jgi:hypothetical protein